MLKPSVNQNMLMFPPVRKPDSRLVAGSQITQVAQNAIRSTVFCFILAEM
ncbi:hypothetical protein [Brenneria alni]|nr:hypothetical protein [Brenneria alni]